MITGKKVLNGLVDSLNEMSLSKMAGALQAVYKSDRYNSLDHLSFLSEIVTPEYNARMETRLNNRLSTAHLKGCPEEIAMCVNSAAREYKPDGIAETLGTLDFIDKGQNVCILGPRILANLIWQKRSASWPVHGFRLNTTTANLLWNPWPR